MNAWEIPGLKSAVFVDGTLNDPRDTDRGWSVEIAFPWRVLAEQARRPAPPREGDQWRVNFSRVQWPFDDDDGTVRETEGRPRGQLGLVAAARRRHAPARAVGIRPVHVARAGRGDASCPTPSWPARAWLHRAYYAQRDSRKAHGRWATSIDDLKLGVPGAGALGANAAGSPAACSKRTSGCEGPVSAGISGRTRWSGRTDMNAMTDQRLRDQLERFVDWEEAHVGFDRVIDGIPAELRGSRAPGFEHTIWQLVEHIRIAQEDILDFCVNAKYVHSMKWPDDYWPKDPAPPNPQAWDRSIASVKARPREIQGARTGYGRSLCARSDRRRPPDLLPGDSAAERSQRLSSGTDRRRETRARRLVVSAFAGDFDGGTHAS